jgi:hypothetical protein
MEGKDRRNIRDISILEPPGLKTITVFTNVENHNFLDPLYEDELKRALAAELVEQLMKQDIIEFSIISNQPYRKEARARIKVYNPHSDIKIMI